MAGAFKRATRQQIKLRMALDGPSGAGKTYTALTLATVLAGGEPFAVIDSEHGSSDRYADLFTFDRLNLEAPFSPERYIEAIRAAQAEGYPVLVIDSITHEWNGAGGVLAEVDRIARVKYRDNKFQAWGDVTPRHNAFIEAMIGSGLHVLVTIRSKTSHAVETDDKGRITGVKKMGMEAQQRDGVEYEFDIVGDLDIGNTLSITKSRAVSLAGQVIARPGEALGRQLLAWTASGERAPDTTREAAPAPAPATAPQPAPMRKPASTNDPATEQQLQAIGKLCVALGKPVPVQALSRDEAKAMIADLSAQFNAPRKAPSPAQAQPTDPSAPPPTADAGEKRDPHGPATTEQLAEIEYLSTAAGMDVPNIRTFIQADLTIKSLKARIQRDQRNAEAAAERSPTDALVGRSGGSPAA